MKKSHPLSLSGKICALIIGALALVLQIIFVIHLPDDQLPKVTQMHGQVGYHVYRHNCLWLSPSLTEYAEKNRRPNSVFDYDTIKEKNFDDLTEPFPNYDTVGYGIILGLLWKITGSLKYRDVQILQIIIFLLSLFLIYQIALILFNSSTVALWCTLSQVLFLPLLAMNIAHRRDVWAYYGTVLLLYAVLNFMRNKGSVTNLILCGIGIAACQFVRQTICISLIALIAVLLLLAFIHKNWSKTLTCIGCLVITNILFFWIPIMTYNKIGHNRFFVSPVGLDLLEGLGEFDNPWGYKLSDEYMNDYIINKYHVRTGTAEFDDKCREEFAAAYAQHPWYYWRNACKRLPTALLPSLQWLIIRETPLKKDSSTLGKILAIATSKECLWHFILAHGYVMLFLILGYSGMALAWYHKNYEALLFAGATILGAFAPSHIEGRYLIPFYWVFSFFVGYCIALGVNFLHQKFGAIKNLLVTQKTSIL